MKEMVGGCCVCSDERGWPDNPLVYCDGNGCTVAVHQACYGIVTVPTGPWYCRKCESPDTGKGKVRCELCPSRSGALKKADKGGWAHVVCALYIPEVRFGNVTSMEPIVLGLIPPERFTRTCYICTENGKAHRASQGACMACNKSGCKQQFHVTCAQSLGLLCEEAGNYLDNVKYCGYCQHHYSKLFTNHEVTVIAKKKGGNVKTIPPYKPVAHDSQSSGSSSEKEGGASPMAGGSGTPAPHTKGSKGPGRKTSQNRDTSKNASKAATANTPQPMDKKKSPSRRQSSTGDGASTSKAITPAPSPSHSTDMGHTSKAPGSSSERVRESSASRSTPPSASPSASKSPQTTGGVISSVASVTAASSTAVPSTSSGVTTVVQAPTASKPTVTFQESVITNTDAIETKHTKKRKAATAAATAAAEQAAQANATTSEQLLGATATLWEHCHALNDSPLPMDTSDKTVKKAKTGSNTPPPAHFLNAPPPPPPLSSSLPHMRSPRHLSSPMPGPSGMNQPVPMNPPTTINQTSTIRSPSHHQGSTEMPAPPSPHVFHQPQKPTTLDSGVPSHSPHAHSQRSNWGGLNVSYELQQDLNKQTVSGVAGPSKDHNGIPITPLAMPPMPPAMRNKKRAAMAAASMSNSSSLPPPSTIQMASTSTQSLANVRRHQSLPPPQQMYQETVKESPPVSPNTERQLKAKAEQQYYSRILSTAPHMLGNELNPDSGAAARLQEQLNAELAAHAVGSAGPDPIVPPPLMNKAAPGSAAVRSTGAQSLDQLLERQWEQGSQFLMEQAQHFDIASLLSCLHQLRTENVRLEEHVSNLLQRRDHLLAVNARLAIPLTSGGVADSTYQLAFQGTVPQMEPRGCSRDVPQSRAPQPPTRVADPGADRERLERQDRAQVAQQLSHQMLMREVQQKPS